MNESKNLTIRIKFRSQQDNLAEDDSLSSYHWGRIIGLSLTLIVAIALFVGGVSYFLNQDNEADKYVKSPSTTFPPASSIQIDSTLTSESEDPVTVPAFSDEFTEQTTAQEQKSTIVINEEENIAEQTAAQEEKSTINLNEEQIVAPQSDVYSVLDVYSTSGTAAKAPVDSPDSDNENKNITQTVTKKAATPPISNTVPAPQFRLTKIDIFSDHIKRFVIASSVASNEPVGTISDINFDVNNIATVYAYSDVSDLQDNTIYYQWILNGKNIAKVRVDVGANRWRSYSSKLIQPHKHGEWKVALQNENGENLASIQFIY